MKLFCSFSNKKKTLQKLPGCLSAQHRLFLIQRKVSGQQTRDQQQQQQQKAFNHLWINKRSINNQAYVDLNSRKKPFVTLAQHLNDWKVSFRMSTFLGVFQGNRNKLGMTLFFCISSSRVSRSMFDPWMKVIKHVPRYACCVNYEAFTRRQERRR